jgi:hypothetical protein
MALREAVRCRAGAATSAGIWYGPGSAEQREERCTASGTRLNYAGLTGLAMPQAAIAVIRTEISTL